MLGANSGNLMFQYAATRVIDGALTHISPAFTPYADTAALRPARALIFPAANHLRAGADWTGLNNYLEGCNKPLVILGLGAQSPHIGGERETIAALRRDAHVRRMADILRERAVLITVRGPFSALACEALDLSEVEVLGCPSALLNPDPNLGRAIEAQLAALPERIAQGQARLAVTAAAPFEVQARPTLLELERKLFAWSGEGLYVQQSGGVEAIRAATGGWPRVGEQARRSIARILAPDLPVEAVGARLSRTGRFFTSAPDWIAAMADCDLALGTRLHGAMAALAAGRPGVIVAHDSRTSELAETMHLPQIDMARALAARGLSAAVQAVRFDGARFDRWRSATAVRLSELFLRAGLPPGAHLTALAAHDFIRRTA